MLSDTWYIFLSLLKYKKHMIFFFSVRKPPDFYYKKHTLDVNKFLWNPASSSLGICGELILD